MSFSQLLPGEGLVWLRSGGRSCWYPCDQLQWNSGSCRPLDTNMAQGWATGSVVSEALKLFGWQLLYEGGKLQSSYFPMSCVLQRTWFLFLPSSQSQIQPFARTPPKPLYIPSGQVSFSFSYIRREGLWGPGSSPGTPSVTHWPSMRHMVLYRKAAMRQSRFLFHILHMAGCKHDASILPRQMSYSIMRMKIFPQLGKHHLSLVSICLIIVDSIWFLSCSTCGMFL